MFSGLPETDQSYFPIGDRVNISYWCSQTNNSGAITNRQHRFHFCLWSMWRIILFHETLSSPSSPNYSLCVKSCRMPFIHLSFLILDDSTHPSQHPFYNDISLIITFPWFKPFTCIQWHCTLVCRIFRRRKRIRLTGDRTLWSANGSEADTGKQYEYLLVVSSSWARASVVVKNNAGHRCVWCALRLGSKKSVENFQWLYKYVQNLDTDACLVDVVSSDLSRMITTTSFGARKKVCNVELHRL